MSETIDYPPELPIVDRRLEILDLVAANQVVIVAGETGSGKSTQLPKMCLELGRGRDAMIGHTQPRRLAARSIAERVASELRSDVGSTVGFAVRFTDRVGPGTRIKLMTDGILLAEIQRDRALRRYDTLIIDEAHERSLNVDFLLGYLHRLLPSRPDLKVIITSATIDTERFSHHFDGAPVVEVSGRTYPVDVRYRPLDGSDGADSRDQPTAICDAVTELIREINGDILVFCSGEREIRDAREALADLDLPDTELFPLYARLSTAEQHRVFGGHRGRRIVLATNVAETSVTVPGVRAVVDPGSARISRYSQRTKVQRLPIEPVSQASAQQRAGRCGRIGPGICIRLYSEADFEARAPFTEPEIQRSNLASVILRMASLGLGRSADERPGFEMVESFPFVDRPDARSVRDGIALLEELNAVDPEPTSPSRWLTETGRTLARLPVDPRLGRMLIEGHQNGCLAEILTIASALSLQDARERPLERRAEADRLHSRFEDPTSDFLAYLNLWRHLRNERKARSSNQFRRMCLREFLHHNRIREWFELRRQLQQIARDLGMRPNRRPAEAEAVHRALLAGLLSHVGRLEPESSRGRRPGYRGARGSRFAIAPGSVLAKKPPPWVVAAELVETDQLRARTVAGIDPEWLEPLSGHVATVSRGEPWWDEDRVAAVTWERVTLYGLPLVTDRTIDYSRVDLAAARRLFIEHALIDAGRSLDLGFLSRNDELLAEVNGLERRYRRRDLLVGQETLIEFYDRRLGPDVVSGRTFERWWHTARRAEPDRLDMTMADVVAVELDVDSGLFPETWEIDGIPLAVSYEFDPYSPIDGATIDIPVEVFNRISEDSLSFHLPGFRPELVDGLVRTLPKDVRRDLIPITETASLACSRLDPSHGSLIGQLSVLLSEQTARPVTPELFDGRRLPGHLVPTIRVVDADGAMLAAGKQLPSLRKRLDQRIRAVLADAGRDVVKEGMLTWDFGPLPTVVEAASGGHVVTGFPALADRRTSVAIELTADRDEQATTMWEGTRRLLRLQLRAPVRTLDRRLGRSATALIEDGSVQTKRQWYDDMIDCAVDALLLESGGPVWNEDQFDELASAVRRRYSEALDSVIAKSMSVADANARAIRAIADLPSGCGDIAADATAHRVRLMYPGVLVGVGLARLDDVARFIEGIVHRVSVVRSAPDRDRQQMARIRPLEQEYRRRSAAGSSPIELEDIGWLLEELRISLFAQKLGTRSKVSEQRVGARLRALAEG